MGEGCRRHIISCDFSQDYDLTSPGSTLYVRPRIHSNYHIFEPIKSDSYKLFFKSGLVICKKYCFLYHTRPGLKLVDLSSKMSSDEDSLLLYEQRQLRNIIHLFNHRFTRSL